MKINITRKIKDLKITVKVEKCVIDKKDYADGYNVDLGKETYERTYITIQKDGSKAITTGTDFFFVLPSQDRVKKQIPGAYAKFGEIYIRESAYNKIKAVVDEAHASLTADSEFLMLKKIEQDRESSSKTEIDQTPKDDQKSAGWCNNCHSYCFGDCTAN